MVGKVNVSTILSPIVGTVKTKHLSFDALIDIRQGIKSQNTTFEFPS